LTLLPTLAPVPNITHDLVIKTTAAGIVLLKENKFRRRYAGNKFSHVDINGRLWVKASDFHKLNKPDPGKIRRKKLPGVETPGAKNNYLLDPNTDAKYENLSTEKTEISTENGGLSTKKTYSVNKPLVRQRILGYINTMRGKKELYFWTVSFPINTTDAVAYQIFNIWLTALRQYKMLKEYLWVAERQQNNTIHFHIAIPHKMPVKRANAMMAGTLATFSKRGEIPFTVHQCKRYNGVDIAKNRHTKKVVNFAIKKGARSLATYLSKYATKNNGTFEHLAWHNSRGYSSMFTGVTFTVPEFMSYGFHLLLDRGKRLDAAFFTFLPWANGPPPLLTDHLYKLNSYLQTILN
jgi:hypothetical protein